MTTVLESLNLALRRALADDPDVIILGEDILDPYGGAFKVTQGCSTLFPDRVIASPISEAALVGIASGMAMRGLHPVVEIMFGDFIPLIADQLINHASKFRWMYNDQVRVPLVIRTPMGGYRGYGPTHSQSLEKIFGGIAGIKVIAINQFADPGRCLYHAIRYEEDPVLFIEHKLLYPLQVYDEKINHDLACLPTQISAPYPTYKVNLQGAPKAQISFFAYSYMTELVTQAMLRLAYEEEIFCELVVPSQLSPFAIQPFLDSALATRHILIIEEGTSSLGWGAEIVARIVESSPPSLLKFARLGAMEHPIPASPTLEKASLPNIEKIIAAAHHLLDK